jgi:hypothetical protein
VNGSFPVSANDWTHTENERQDSAAVIVLLLIEQREEDGKLGVSIQRI